MRVYFDWTDARCDKLRQYHADGLPFSQMADKIGGGLTRNAVIGKAHRLGLRRDRDPSQPRAERPKAPRAERSKPPRQYKRRSQAWKPPPEDPVPEPEIEAIMSDHDIPFEQRRSLMELTSNTCRWPVGEPSSPDFFFCGALPLNGNPYCGAHCARAFSGSSLRSISTHRLQRVA